MKTLQPGLRTPVRSHKFHRRRFCLNFSEAMARDGGHGLRCSTGARPLRIARRSAAELRQGERGGLVSTKPAPTSAFNPGEPAAPTVTNTQRHQHRRAPNQRDGRYKKLRPFPQLLVLIRCRARRLSGRCAVRARRAPPQARPS